MRSRLARFLIGAYEVPPWLVRLLAPGHEIMQRKQLRELKKRVD